MKKFLSIRYSAGAFNFATLFLRIGAGILLMNHGYQKLINFASLKTQFIDFLGIGSTTSLSLAIFAEFFCGLFIVIGLFTRLAAIPIIITMCVALFKVHHADFFGKGELPALYLAMYVALLFVGPGRISVDGMINK